MSYFSGEISWVPETTSQKQRVSSINWSRIQHSEVSYTEEAYTIGILADK